MSFKTQQCFCVVFVGCLAQSTQKAGCRYPGVVISNQPNTVGWALPVVLDFVCDLECTGVTKPHYTNMGGWWNWNELAGSCLFMEESGVSAPKRDLPSDLSDWGMQHQPSYVSLAVLLGGWYVGGGKPLHMSGSHWRLNSWVLKLSKSYKTAA